MFFHQICLNKQDKGAGLLVVKALLVYSFNAFSGLAFVLDCVYFSKVSMKITVES